MSNCQRKCNDAIQLGSVTFFSLESNQSDTMKTILTIRPSPDGRTYSKETELADSYTMLCDVGGVVGVYTGLSFAAVIRVLVIILAAGYVFFLAIQTLVP